MTGSGMGANTLDHIFEPFYMTEEIRMDTVTRHGISENGANFIQKPFSPAELIGRVHQLPN